MGNRWGAHFWEVPKTAFRFSNSLGGLTEFSKAVILSITVCYSVRIQIKINKRRHIRQGLGEFQGGASQWSHLDSTYFPEQCCMATLMEYY